MNTFDIDKLPIKQYDAPEGFTDGVMKKIQASQPAKPNKNRNMYRSGMILIAASLIALFIGLTPVMDIFEDNVYSDISVQRDSGMGSVSENIRNMTAKISYLLNRPVDLISQAINKEDLHDGQ
ncbi:MAG TPA: hypothetical protein VFD33_06870 [Bacillota bacterium]|nr:hypothetical protein [Bacillota bacterium]